MGAVLDPQYKVSFKLNREDGDRKTFERWLKDNVGSRGRDWFITKPKGFDEGRNCTVSFVDKEKAALTKMCWLVSFVASDSIR